MDKKKPKCCYCGKEIQGYVEKSKLNPNIKLCNTCYYIEMFSIAMSKNIKETEENVKNDYKSNSI